MKCCTKCFVDSVVLAQIQRLGSAGWCDYCEKRRARVVEAASLCELFHPVVSLFRPEEITEDMTEVSGCSLVRCIEERAAWKVFSPRFTTSKRCELLDEIRMIDVVPDSDEYCRVGSGEMWLAPQSLLHHSHGEYVWANFAETIKRKRRYLPEHLTGDSASPRTCLPEVLGSLACHVSPSKTYFRARMDGLIEGYEVRRPYPSTEMGAPSHEKATPGRANPRGIPYLYVAESQNTAIAEMRPSTGDVISIATMRPRSKLRLADLTRVPVIKSPFGILQLKVELERNGLLTVLNRELSKPVTRSAGDVEYVPTQYLAEVILNAGFDGIRYRSAMHPDGHNVVLFDPSKMRLNPRTVLVRVRATDIAYSKVAEYVDDQRRRVNV